MGGETDEGASNIIRSMMTHPLSALAILAGMASGISTGTVAYFTVSATLADHTRRIDELAKRVDDNDRKSDLKLDMIARDVGEMKSGIAGLNASISIMLRQQIRPPQ